MFCVFSSVNDNDVLTLRQRPLNKHVVHDALSKIRRGQGCSGWNHVGLICEGASGIDPWAWFRCSDSHDAHFGQHGTRLR